MLFTDSDAPYKIDVFENYLYMTTYYTHSILKLDKFTNSSNITTDKGKHLMSQFELCNHQVSPL